MCYKRLIYAGIPICAALLCVADALAAQEADSSRRPNVLMICIDDLNDFVNCMNSYPGKVHTPNIDRLAARGRLFTNAHCTASMCGPSRNSILSGKYPWTTGLYSNRDVFLKHLQPSEAMPAHFKAAGYYVAGAGKIFHQGARYNSRELWNEYHRFDTEYVWIPEGHPINGLDRKKYKMYPTMDWGPLEPPNIAMYDDETTRYAAEFLGRKHEQPFFLAAGIVLPHIPWYAPRKFFDMYPLEDVALPPVKQNDLDDVPKAATRHIGLWRQDLPAIDKAGKRVEAVRAYLACISYVDFLVGEMLDTLDAGPNANNTIVVLWSDHGWHLGEKDWWHKFTLWERSTRVPLVIAGPEVNQPGAACSRPASLVDIYPTLIEMCGIPPRNDLDGISLVPQLKNPKAERDHPALTTYMRGDHAVRNERWRYIRYYNGEEELYDHETDPNEWTNLAGDSQYDAIKGELAAWIPQVDKVDAGGNPTAAKAAPAAPQK